MVRFLLLDILDGLVHIFWANRETSVPALPIEIGEGFALRLDPFGRTRFDLFDDLRQGQVPRKPKYGMDVVACTPDLEGL
jgi:hypothetical protein